MELKYHKYNMKGITVTSLKFNGYGGLNSINVKSVKITLMDNLTCAVLNDKIYITCLKGSGLGCLRPTNHIG